MERSLATTYDVWSSRKWSLAEWSDGNDVPSVLLYVPTKKVRKLRGATSIATFWFGAIATTNMHKRYATMRQSWLKV